jgi:hypothetical protein
MRHKSSNQTGLPTVEFELAVSGVENLEKFVKHEKPADYRRGTNPKAFSKKETCRNKHRKSATVVVEKYASFCTRPMSKRMDTGRDLSSRSSLHTVV